MFARMRAKFQSVVALVLAVMYLLQCWQVPAAYAGDGAPSKGGGQHLQSRAAAVLPAEAGIPAHWQVSHPPPGMGAHHSNGLAGPPLLPGHRFYFAPLVWATPTRPTDNRGQCLQLRYQWLFPFHFFW